MKPLHLTAAEKAEIVEFLKALNGEGWQAVDRAEVVTQMNRRYFIYTAGAALGAGCNRNRKRSVAVIPKGSAHLFWQSVHAGAVKCARERNADVIGTVPRPRSTTRPNCRLSTP